MSPRVHIRWMIRRDMPQVLSIGARSFDEPPPEEEFVAFLRQRHHIGMVAELGERVVGYMLYELARDRITLRGLTVDPAFRRRTIGRQMVTKLVAKLSSRGRPSLFVPVPEGNTDVHLFLKSVGLRAVEVVRAGDGGEDVYLFHRLHEEAMASC